jgi:hypothetical protein
VKRIVLDHLVSQGWECESTRRGNDIAAERGAFQWLIRVKGTDSSKPRPANHDLFAVALGETIRRMDDPKCEYSIALQDLEQFRRTWRRIPLLAKNRTGITALFASLTGEVTEIFTEPPFRRPARATVMRRPRQVSGRSLLTSANDQDDQGPDNHHATDYQANQMPPFHCLFAPPCDAGPPTCPRA